MGGGGGRGYPQRQERIIFFPPPDTAKKDAVVADKSHGGKETQAVYVQDPTDSQGSHILREAATAG